MWPTNHFVTHYFITFIVQNLNALINVTKGPLIYEQYQHFLFVLMSTVAYMVLNIQLFKNSHALSPTFLFIYLSVLFHFSVVHTYMKKHHRLMPQYSMRKCSMCIFYGLLLWWYPGTLFLGFSLFLDFLCTHLVY